MLCDELNEDIHYWQIRSWIGLGDTDNALKQYETAVKFCYTVAPDQTFKMEDKDVIEVTMVDYQASGFGKVTVTKKVTFANGGDFVDLIAQDDTFYVNLFTDAAGNILDLDVFEYEVTGEGTVALSKDNLAGNINLVNKIPEDTDGKLRV